HQYPKLNNSTFFFNPMNLHRAQFFRIQSNVSTNSPINTRSLSIFSSRPVMDTVVLSGIDSINSSDIPRHKYTSNVSNELSSKLFLKFGFVLTLIFECFLEVLFSTTSGFST